MKNPSSPYNPQRVEPLFAFAALSLGAIIGSFLNVIIHRYPRDESIVFPPSHCPHCNAVIKSYDNVPVLSYLWLRGRCRSCAGPISIRYPLVELANALFYLAIFQRTGLSWVFIPVAAIVSMLIALIYIDAEIQILPDVIDIPGVAVGLIIGTMAGGVLHPDLILSRSLIDSFMGAGIGSGILLAVALAYKLVRHVEGMGLGDVKMMAMLGATLGWEPLPGAARDRLRHRRDRRTDRSRPQPKRFARCDSVRRVPRHQYPDRDVLRARALGAVSGAVRLLRKKAFTTETRRTQRKTPLCVLCVSVVNAFS